MEQEKRKGCDASSGLLGGVREFSPFPVMTEVK